MTRGNLGRGQLTSPYRSYAITYRIQGKNSIQGTRSRNQSSHGMLLAGFLPMACLAASLCNSGPGATTHNGLGSLISIAFQEMSHRVSYRPKSYEDIFSIVSPISQVALTCVSSWESTTKAIYALTDLTQLYNTIEQ